MKKVLIVVILAAVAAWGGWKIYQRVTEAQGGPGGGKRDVVVAVEIAPIEKGTIVETGIFTGTLDPRSQFVASPKVGGRLEKLMVDIGDRIENGALLALIDDDEYVQQLEQSKADREVSLATVRQAASALNTAKRELERIQALNAKNIASESELDAVKAQYTAAEAAQAVAQAQVNRADAALKAAEIRVAYTRITADWDDTGAYRYVGERFAEQGTMLRANDPIVSIIDMSVLTGVVFIIDIDYAKVRAGQAAVVTSDAFPDRTFTGTVTRIAPLLREMSRQARIEIAIPNTDLLLKPGMFIRTELEFATHKDVPLVPQSALARRENTQGVFIVDTTAKTVKFTPVKTGFQRGRQVEIVTPADIAGMVVTLGHHILQDGSAVMWQEEQRVEDGAEGAVK